MLLARCNLTPQLKVSRICLVLWLAYLLHTYVAFDASAQKFVFIHGELSNSQDSALTIYSSGIFYIFALVYCTCLLYFPILPGLAMATCHLAAAYAARSPQVFQAFCFLSSWLCNIIGPSKSCTPCWRNFVLIPLLCRITPTSS